MEGKKQSPMHFMQMRFQELEIQFQQEHRAIWCYLRPSGRPCCTDVLLIELMQFLRAIVQHLKTDDRSNNRESLRFLVFASRTPGVFSFGGDLILFQKLIKANDRAGLLHYVRSCIDMVYFYYHMPITTISLVQGDALGGGLEGALMSRVLIAEQQAQMGLPEILFNLFPGMGAYSIIARRLGSSRAEQLIFSGRTYSAEELYKMGLVDVLAENGHGEEAVLSYIKKFNRAPNGHESVFKARQIYHPLTYDELMRIGMLWVDAALQLSERDLRIMERIAQSQEKLVSLRSAEDIKQLA